jgi:mRNA-degrading endonuclease toxin of MazEF toxin-antitoxin module
MQPSAIKCENIYTFNNRRVLGRLGQLFAGAMHQVNDCLKAALDLP